MVNSQLFYECKKGKDRIGFGLSQLNSFFYNTFKTIDCELNNDLLINQIESFNYKEITTKTQLSSHMMLG